MSSYCYNVSKRGHKVFATVHPKPGPVLITFHGGGIIQGSRRDEHIPQPLTAWPGALVEADYRLLAPSSGLDIAEDARALLLFLAGHSVPGADNSPLAPEQAHQIVVSGFSGGGYPMRLAGIASAEEAQSPNPRFTVRALLSGFGMGGDFLLDIWLRPLPLDAAYTEAAFPAETEEERAALAARQEEQGARVRTIMQGPEVSDAPYTQRLAGHEPRRQAIWDWFHCCGTLNDLISGREGWSEHLKTLPYDQRLATIPAELALAYPQVYFDRHPERVAPMLLLHGDRDQAVSYKESETTLSQLQKNGTELITVHGTAHDLKIGDKVTKEGNEAWEYALKWALNKVNPSMH